MSGGQSVVFDLEIAADEGSWTDTFSIVVRKDADISAHPEFFEITIPRETSTVRTLTIENTGIGALSFLLTPQPNSIEWLLFDVESGEVLPGQSQDVAVTFDATALDYGSHAGHIQITSNDPDEAVLELPVLLEVVEAPRYMIVATAGNNGTIAPAGDVEVIEGQDQTFEITANLGFQVDGVLVDGLSVGAVRHYTFTHVTDNHTIHATFVTGPTHTITATAGDHGSMAPSGEVLINENYDITFQITADPYYRVADVLVDGQSVGAVSSYTFVSVTQEHTLVALFEALPTHRISASAGEHGTIFTRNSSRTKITEELK
jgi:hypothetical protein